MPMLCLTIYAKGLNNLMNTIGYWVNDKNDFEKR